MVKLNRMPYYQLKKHSKKELLKLEKKELIKIILKLQATKQGIDNISYKKSSLISHFKKQMIWHSNRLLELSSYDYAR